MAQWFGRIIYIIFVGIASFVVITFAQMEKVTNFLKDQKEELVLEDERLIQSYVIANYADGSEAYVLKEPLYNKTFESDDKNYKLNLVIYNYVTLVDDKRENSLAFIVKDVVINTKLAFKDDLKRPILDIKLLLSEAINFEGQSFGSTLDTFIWFLDSETAIFPVNYNVFKTNNGHIDIEGIEITYRPSDNESVSPILLSLGDDFKGDQMPLDADRNIDVIKSDNIDLVSSTEGNSYMNNELIYYDNDLTSLFKSYNIVYVKYAAGFIVALGIITYFLFFHKYVRSNYLSNRETKEKEMKSFIESLDDEHLN